MSLSKLDIKLAYILKNLGKRIMYKVQKWGSCFSSASMHRDSVRIIVMANSHFEARNFFFNHPYAIRKNRCPNAYLPLFCLTNSYLVPISPLLRHTFPHLTQTVNCSIFYAPNPFKHTSGTVLVLLCSNLSIYRPFSTTSHPSLQLTILPEKGQCRILDFLRI